MKEKSYHKFAAQINFKSLKINKMKKILNLLIVLTISLLFVKCSNDDESRTNTPEGTLFVNGSTFQIGTNSAGNSYNTSIYTESSVYRNRTFTILKGNSTTPENSESITFVLYSPKSQANINGTYDLTVNSMDAMSNSTSYSFCSLENFNHIYGGDYIFASGTVTVVDNGNNNFKLTFNNVVLKNQDSPTDTKTITGYCQATFQTF